MSMSYHILLHSNACLIIYHSADNIERSEKCFEIYRVLCFLAIHLTQY